MSKVRDYLCSWLAVTWCSAFQMILWLYVEFLDLPSSLSSFYILRFFIISIFFRETDIHICSKFPFLLTHLVLSQHRISVRKRRKGVKPIAVGYVKVIDQPWRIICSLYKILMSKTFPQVSSEAFLNLEKSALPRTKKKQKNFTSVFQQSALKTTSKERHGFIWLLKKKTCWHSPTSFE